MTNSDIVNALRDVATADADMRTRLAGAGFIAGSALTPEGREALWACEQLQVAQDMGFVRERILNGETQGFDVLL